MPPAPSRKAPPTTRAMSLVTLSLVPDGLEGALFAERVALAVGVDSEPTSTPPVTGAAVLITVWLWVRRGLGLKVCVTTRFGVGLGFGDGVTVLVAAGVGARVGAGVGLGSGITVGPACGAELSDAAGEGAAATRDAPASAGWATASDRSGRARSPAAATRAETRAVGMARCYGHSRRHMPTRGANLLVDLRVVVVMSAVGTRAQGGQVAVVSSSHDVLTALYTAHYRELVRLAAFLTSDRDNAEEVVQDAFVKVHGSWRGLRELDKGEAYLRTAVVNASRSRLRRRQVAARHRPDPLRDMASAESLALEVVQREAVQEALHRLPRRQREAVVLRYYGDLTEAQTAAAMGCSVGSVKSHTSRAMAALRPLLEDRR